MLLGNASFCIQFLMLLWSLSIHCFLPIQNIYYRNHFFQTKISKNLLHQAKYPFFQISKVLPLILSIGVFNGRSPEITYAIDNLIVNRDIDAFNLEVETTNRQLARESRAKISLPRTKRNSLLNSDKKLDDASIENAIIKVLTLKPYLEEVEKSLFENDWGKLNDYLLVVQEQDPAFSILISDLFPTMDPPDVAARESLRFEGEAFFNYLKLLKEAIKNEDFSQARFSYARLIYSYDKFLKAGTLYPSYDPIASYDIFFRSTPQESLKFDRDSELNILDRVVLTKGPDMGKTATLINIEGENEKSKAIVKFDYDGKAYQEVKMVDLAWLAKAAPDP